MDKQTLERALRLAEEKFGLVFTKYEDGVAVSELTIEEHHLNQLNIPYGGYIFNMLDITCGAANLSAGGSGPTISANTEFIHGCSVGDHITCTGKVDKCGRRICYASGEIRTDDGRLVARVNVTFCCIQ